MAAVGKRVGELVPLTHVAPGRIYTAEHVFESLNPEQLENIYVTGPDNKLVPLSTVAAIRSKTVARSLTLASLARYFSKRDTFQGAVAKLVRQRSAKPLCTGSTPVRASIKLRSQSVIGSPAAFVLHDEAKGEADRLISRDSRL